MAFTIHRYTIVTPNGSKQEVRMQLKGDRLWVRLYDLANILDINLNEWYVSYQGTRILSAALKKGLSFHKVNNSIWAIDELALEIVKCFENAYWLFNQLSKIFNARKYQRIDFSAPVYWTISEEEAERMRMTLNQAYKLPMVELPKAVSEPNWLIEAILKAPEEGLKETYNGLAVDVGKIRERSVESVTTIARVLLDSTPAIRQVIIEAKVNGDWRNVATIKAEKEQLMVEVDSWKITQQLIADSDVDTENIQNIDPVEALGKAFETITNDNKKERDSIVNATEIGLELGLSEETINLLLTHHGFQIKQILREKPLICSYHPTVLGLQFCTHCLIVECDVEPDYYYRPVWHWGIIKALETKIKP